MARQLLRDDGTSTGTDSSSEDEPVRADENCCPLHVMEVRVNVDKLTQIKQLEESFQARLFFQARRKLDKNALSEDPNKEREKMEKCCKFLQKHVVPDPANIEIKLGQTKTDVHLEDIQESADEVLQKVRDQYLDKDMKRGRCKLSVENLRNELSRDDCPSLVLKATSGGEVEEVQLSWVISGEFGEKFELQEFPFDSQELSVTLCLGVQCERKEKEALQEQLRFIRSRDEQFQSRVNLCVFSLGNSWTKPKKVVVKTSWTRAKQSAQGHRFPIVKISVFVQRKYQFYMWNIIFPVFAIAWMSACTLSINIDKVADRLSSSLTLVLTAVAYKYIAAQMVPTIGYNTWLDLYVLMCFGFLVVIVMENCAAETFIRTSEREQAIGWVVGLLFVALNSYFALWARWLRAKARRREDDEANENERREWYPELHDEDEMTD